MSVGGGEFYTAIFLGGTGRQKAGINRRKLRCDWMQLSLELFECQESTRIERCDDQRILGEYCSVKQVVYEYVVCRLFLWKKRVEQPPNFSGRHVPRCLIGLVYSQRHCTFILSVYFSK
jgi:hypothetical protein